MRGVVLSFFLSAAAFGAPASIVVDYPAEGSIFPPEITAPVFLWRDSAEAAAVWKIEVSFADGSPALHLVSRGERMRLGPIDRECIAPTNEPPRLTPQQAAARTWTPTPATWAEIKKHSGEGAATVTIRGYARGGARAVSLGRVTIHTSRDPVGAPVFYRDVPLMPTETSKGDIKPLAPYAIHLIRWRLRNIGEPKSRVVLENMPMCINCHSFAADGRTVGLDMDGLQNNRGMYALAPVARQTSIHKENVIQWSTERGRLRGKVRIGFMSQVSPNGEYVVTTVNPSTAPEPPSNYYVANFTDYRFLQVFFPTRGYLGWYSRETGMLKPLPGADDPRFVNTGAVWSPDGKFLVFARAEATDPNPPGAKLARFANDPGERQVRYDLYRIPFNDGRGGAAEPLAGASGNGMSNTFPKVSPDGRWIVFVRCRNGLLMRPDSELYIVPAGGGEARRMRCNLHPMNSWHSFSPNGRWLVFSSKSRSPYTQMYLTHIDEQGNDSPAILVENTTASNRAVNIPEFVNIPPDGLREIGGPAIDFYRYFDGALYLQKQGRYAEAIGAWRGAIEADPAEPMSRSNLAATLLLAGRPGEAAVEFRKAEELKLRKALENAPDSAPLRASLGKVLLDEGGVDEALAELRRALALDPKLTPARVDLAAALLKAGQGSEAFDEAGKALEADPGSARAQYQMGMILAARGDTDAAIAAWRRAARLDPNHAEAHRSLAGALSRQGKAAEAMVHWREVIRLRPDDAKALREAAWILATSQDASVRNGSDALGFAVRAVRLVGTKDSSVLEALAAAYAEAGRFPEAALTARRALALVPRDPDLKARLAQYEARTPFRETAVQRP